MSSRILVTTGILCAMFGMARAHESFEEHLPDKDSGEMREGPVGKDWSKSAVTLFNGPRIQDVRLKWLRRPFSDPFVYRSYEFEVYEDHGQGFRVTGVSPVVRMIPYEIWAKDTSYRCSEFRGTRAVIFVHGICGWHQEADDAAPWGIGSSWDHMDAGNLRAVAYWSRNQRHPDPPNDNRLNGKVDPPATYFQFVENFGGYRARGDCSSWDGARGNVDGRAVQRLLNNLALAWVAGVTELEIVSHSNGAITTHVAWKHFVNYLPTLRRASPARMRVHINHLQSAPRHRSSMIPVNSRYLKPSDPRLVLDRVHFWYNHPDATTYDFWHKTSPVGRPFSLQWVRAVWRPYRYRKVVRLGFIPDVEKVPDSTLWDKSIGGQWLCETNDAKCGDHPNNGDCTGCNHWENFALRDYSNPDMLNDREGPMVWVYDSYLP